MEEGILELIELFEDIGRPLAMGWSERVGLHRKGFKEDLKTAIEVARTVNTVVNE